MLFGMMTLLPGCVCYNMQLCNYCVKLIKSAMMTFPSSFLNVHILDQFGCRGIQDRYDKLSWVKRKISM